MLNAVECLGMVARQRRQRLPYPPRSLGMCGLIKMLVYRKGVTDVLHVTKEEVKKTRQRLASEDWTIYHTELI